jgi:PAS domain S-box-containing protein
MRNVNVGSNLGQSKTIDYIIAIAGVASVALLVQWMSPYFDRTEPAPVSVCAFLCIVLLSAWRGVRPGSLAFLMSLVSLYCLFRPSSALMQLATRDELRLAYFSVVGIGITALGAAKNAALSAAWSANGDLAQAVLELKLINQKLESDGLERERVNKKLRFSEALLTEGQRISHTGSWLLNMATNKLLWSEEHYRIFGYEPDTGEPTFGMVMQRMHANDRERIGRVVREAMRVGARFECEYRLDLPGGVLRHILATGFQTQTDCEGSGEYIGISVDITERRKAEELLRKREQEFRTLAENSPDSVIRYDLDCRRIYVNPAYELTRAAPANLMLHQPLELNWHWNTPVDEYVRRLRRIIDTGQPDQMFDTRNAPNGKQVHCAIRMVAERDTNGSVVSVLAIIRDISSLKQAQLRLEESQDQLRQLANRSETVREEERKHLARELHDDLAQYLLTLRMKILTLDMEFGPHAPSLAKKTAGMIALVDSSITVVRNIVTSLRPAVLDMGIVWALEWLAQQFIAQTGIDCHLRSPDKATCLNEAHAVAFFRIAQEALRNVVKHAGATEVDINFYRKDDTYLLKVKDNGAGFDPKIKKAASFGLIGIRERALMFGGKVDICAAPDRGTLIQVCIPIHSVRANE